MLCRDFREVADSYLSDELSVETNHDFLAHREICGACRAELAARCELRSTLRAGFANSPELQIDQLFARRLREQLAADALQPALPQTRRRVWLAIAACLILALGFGFFTLRNQFRTPPDRLATSPPAPEVEVAAGPDSKVAEGLPRNELIKFAVGDHQNCAIQFHLPNTPISLEEAGRRYDRAYVSLKEAMEERLKGLADPPALVEVHSCIFAGRRFAHFVFKQNGHVISFLVTDYEVLETGTQKTNKATNGDGQMIACSQLDGYQVSCLQTKRHAIFVVSDLSEGDNLALARTLAPGIYEHLSRAERVA
jgi:hypothetical protein